MISDPKHRDPKQRDPNHPVKSVSNVEDVIVREARFQLGQIVKHRIYPFRGVIYDVDPTFSNTDEWYDSIPEDVRPRKNQPFYHLYAENEQTVYEAYVSEQNLLPDLSEKPLRHPLVKRLFREFEPGQLKIRKGTAN